MLKIDKSLETEYRLLVATGWVGYKGIGSDCRMGMEFPLGGDENVVELDSVDGV